MPVPDFQSLMLPVLREFSDGEASLSEVRERTAAAEGLSSENLREMLSGGRQTVFVNRVSWAVTYMERAGFLERVRRGVYRLTQYGESLLSREPGLSRLDFVGFDSRCEACCGTEEVQQETVVPAGLLQLSAHRRHSPAIGRPRQVQRQLPHHRQVLGTVAPSG